MSFICFKHNRFDFQLLTRVLYIVAMFVQVTFGQMGERDSFDNRDLSFLLTVFDVASRSWNHKFVLHIKRWNHLTMLLVLVSDLMKNVSLKISNIFQHQESPVHVWSLVFKLNDYWTTFGGKELTFLDHSWKLLFREHMPLLKWATVVGCRKIYCIWCAKRDNATRLGDVPAKNRRKLLLTARCEIVSILTTAECSQRLNFWTQTGKRDKIKEKYQELLR